MRLAIPMGLIGHLCAAFITVFGGYAVLNVLNGQPTSPVPYFTPKQEWVWWISWPVAVIWP